ncbi:hypothetical protein B0H16DRAFT_1471718 [Mycena metata]|uniref:Uncharacterized protein n=1 Tax=Mycena metata TaxID=1033252 RepID=A0AAD7HQ67_9AGAR|nr:hypothetical protein B0H16DRAFT_1471718 [Mycena metata]
MRNFVHRKLLQAHQDSTLRPTSSIKPLNYRRKLIKSIHSFICLNTRDLLKTSKLQASRLLISLDAEQPQQVSTRFWCSESFPNFAVDTLRFQHYNSFLGTASPPTSTKNVHALRPNNAVSDNLIDCGIPLPDAAQSSEMGYPVLSAALLGVAAADRAAARCRCDGSTAPVERVPCPFRR